METGSPVKARPSAALSATLYLRGVGAVLLGTFVSFWTQLDVLCGENGLVPAAGQLSASVSAWRRPSLLWWWGTSDVALSALMVTGLVGSVLLLLDRVRPLAVLLTGSAYLSLVSAGGVFFQFQWDNLVMEALWLCLLLPWRRENAPGRAVVWAFVLLLFRLYVESAVVKWAWGARSWGRLEAMDHYYETAPLPLFLGFVAHQLPHAWHVMEEVATFALEGALPFCFFLPRRFRVPVVAAGLSLQVMIALTASYGSFNLMTALLFVWLLDDDHWRAWFPHLTQRFSVGKTPRGNVFITSCVTTHALLCAAFFISMMDGRASVPWLLSAEHALTPWRITHTWHLFADVTLTRPTVEVEGSVDGVNWTAYHFKHAPGPATQSPPLWLSPHHPRAAFQMWFLALQPRAEPWFQNILKGLCQDHSPVHALFSNPPLTRPRMLRVNQLDYRMATLDAWWDDGTIWIITPVKQGLPVNCP